MNWDQKQYAYTNTNKTYESLKAVKEAADLFLWIGLKTAIREKEIKNWTQKETQKCDPIKLI